MARPMPRLPPDITTTRSASGEGMGATLTERRGRARRFPGAEALG